MRERSISGGSLAVILGLVACSPALGWASTPCLAITDGRLHLPGGDVQVGSLLIEDGRIAGVGVDLVVPTKCAGIDASGLEITAGLVDPATELGLVEISLEARTADMNPKGEHGEHGEVRAGFSVADAYNPRSSLIPITRVEGVTSTVTRPVGGVVHGSSAWVDLAGGSQAASVQRAPLAVHASVGGRDGSRADALQLLGHLIDEARVYRRTSKAWGQNKARGFDFSRRDLEAMQPVLSGRIPLVVRANRASDIEALLRMRASAGLRLVIEGGAEAWLLADQLAASDVAVIVDPLLYGIESFDGLAARKDHAHVLQRAGVTLMMSAFDTHNARSLRQVAGNAVREGLSPAAALKAITETPAEVFGLERHGRLAVGAKANIVVWSGDPLELLTSVRHLVIGGDVVDLETRQTRLRDRYMTLPGTPRPPLSLP